MTRFDEVTDHPLLDELAAEAATWRLKAGELLGPAELRGYADAIAYLQLIRDIPTLHHTLKPPAPTTHRRTDTAHTRPLSRDTEVARGETTDGLRQTP
jgi:hypothetical protein